MICKNCGTVLDNDMRFCPTCGTEVPKITEPEQSQRFVCSKCGAVLVTNAKFCMKCGASVKTVSPPAPQLPQEIISNVIEKEQGRRSKKRAFWYVVVSACLIAALVGVAFLRSHSVTTYTSEDVDAVEREYTDFQEEDVPDIYAGIETTTPFGGSNFTFGLDDNMVRIPCTYREFIEATGLELYEDYASDPARNPVDDGKDCSEFSFLLIPGTNTYATASYHLQKIYNQDGVIVRTETYLDDKEDREARIKVDSYGDCIVYMVYAFGLTLDEIEQNSRFTFPCGVKIGMSRDEVYERLGEPYKTVV